MSDRMVPPSQLQDKARQIDDEHTLLLAADGQQAEAEPLALPAPGDDGAEEDVPNGCEHIGV